MDNPQLYSIAQVLLKEKVVEFDKLLQSLKSNGIKTFLKQNQKILDRIVDVESLIEEDVESVDEVLILLAIAVELQLVQVIDWSGEEFPGQVRKRISRMLTQSNYPFEWKNKKIEEQILELKPKRGEYLPLLFRALNKELEQSGLCLGFLDIGQDCYYYFVATKSAFGSIVDIEEDGFKILDTDIYEIYLLTDGEQSSKLLLYLKNKLGIPLGEIKTFLQQEKILLETGNLSVIQQEKKALDAVQGKYEVIKLV